MPVYRLCSCIGFDHFLQRTSSKSRINRSHLFQRTRVPLPFGMISAGSWSIQGGLCFETSHLFLVAITSRSHARKASWLFLVLEKTLSWRHIENEAVLRPRPNLPKSLCSLSSAGFLIQWWYFLTIGHRSFHAHCRWLLQTDHHYSIQALFE